MGSDACAAMALYVGFDAQRRRRRMGSGFNAVTVHSIAAPRDRARPGIRTRYQFARILAERCSSLRATFELSAAKLASKTEARSSGPTLVSPQVKKWDQYLGAQKRMNTVVEIAKLAGAQDGVVARRELLAAGVSPAVVVRHLENGGLRTVYRAVYSVGHVELSQIGRWRAAILLAGDGACLSHLSAARIHRLIDDARFAQMGMIHVSRRSGGRTGVRPALAAGQPAARIHRLKTLHGDDIVIRRGLPVTSVERTLIDLATLFPRRKLESAILAAQRLHLVDPYRLADRLRDPMIGHQGIATLRELVEGAVPAKAKTLSDPEAWMLDLILGHGLPEPEVNEWVEGFMVDFYWREQRLIVEFDGHGFHSSRDAMRRDKRRSRALQLAGYRVLRYTYEDLTEEPERVAAEIAAALAAR